MSIEEVSPSPVEAGVTASPTAPPPAEAPVPAEILPNPAVEALKNMSPRDRTARYLGGAKTIIEENSENPEIFDTTDKEEAAANALSYQGGIDRDSSNALKSLLDSLKVIPGDKAQGTYGEITKYARVQVVEEGSEKIYTLEEWESRLAQTATPEERAQLDNQAIYGFQFPQETAPAETEKPQTVEDRVIAEQLTVVADEIKTINLEETKNKIKELKGKGKQATPEEQEELRILMEQQVDLPKYQQLLAALNLAKEGKGRGGVFLKRYALEKLAKIKGTANVDGLELALASVGKNLSDAQRELVEYALASGGLSREELQNLAQGGVQAAEGLITKLVTSGKVLNNKNLLTYFFGREVPVDELTSMLADTGLDPEHLNFLQKHGKEAKGGGLILLLLLLMGVKNAFTDLAMPQRMAA